ESLMVPRADMVYLDIQLPVEENLQRLIESEHSRFPVCDGGLDKMLGVVHAKRVLANIARGEPPDFTTQLSPCLYVLETLTAMELLAQFRGSEASMAFVLDEYGEIEG